MDWRDARISAQVGPGWEPLVDELHARVLEIDPGIVVEQVKEKFGGLRYYFRADDGNQRINALVAQYEKRASETCEWCGASAETEPNKRGWLKTLCPPHREAWDREERWWNGTTCVICGGEIEPGPRYYTRTGTPRHMLCEEGGE